MLQDRMKPFPVRTALSCQEESVSNSAHRRPSVTPLGGAVSPATGHVRPATALIQQPATFVLMATPLSTDNAPRLTAHWDNIMMV